MSHLRPGRLGLAALLGVAGLGLASQGAHADSLCAGTVTGSVLQALPTPVTVSLSQPVADDPNPRLTKDFLDGIRSAGQAVLPPNQGNVQVDMTVTVTGPDGASGGTSNTFRGFGWLSGTQVPGGGAPGGGVPGVPIGSRVSISVEATTLSSQTLSWIGTIACTVRAGDPDQLATHFGALVGKALGRSIDHESF